MTTPTSPQPAVAYQLPEKTFNGGSSSAMELGDAQYRFRHLRDNSDSGSEELDELDCTANDARDMQRLGRTQEMRRNFRSLSMLSFTIIVQATWEFVLVSVLQFRMETQLLMRIQVADSRVDGWGSGGYDMVVRVDDDRFSSNRRQSRRDGLNGSNIRRPGACLTLHPVSSMPPS